VIDLSERHAGAVPHDLLADATTTGTPIDGVDGLLNQMTKAALERPCRPR
jgi:putative transposase